MSAALDTPAGVRRHRRTWRRAARAGAGVATIAVVAGTATWLLLPGRQQPAPAANDQVPLGVATVTRRALVNHQDVDGTLGYPNARPVGAPASGTITRLRAEGAIVARGRSLMSIDAKATAFVLYGTRPMYRDLGPGVSDGGDVRQLERNLVALGYDPGTVDDAFTSATTAAVKAFQADRGLDETGTLRRTDVVISNGPARVGTHKAQVGDAARPGAPVTEITTSTPVVSAKVDAANGGALHQGDAVDITMPDGSPAHGRVADVGRIATAGSQGGAPTVDLTVALRGRRRTALDGAPVTVSLATGRTEPALAVPVTALVATEPGVYAVELAGSGRLVPVRLGASAGGWAQISGAGLTDGMRVVVPR